MSLDGINNKRADVSKLQKAGLHKSDFKDNEKMKSIFDAMDTDGNGIIDEEELQNFIGIDKNNDGTIKRSEAGKFLKEHTNLKELGIKKRDVIEFLNKSEIIAGDIEEFSGDKENGFTVDYKNNTQKTIDKEGNYFDYDTEGNSETRTKEDALLCETKTDPITGDKTTTEYIDGDKEKVKSETVVEKETGSVTTTTFENGDKTKPVSNKVVKGTTTEQYQYVEKDGKSVPRINSKVIDKGNGVEERHAYSYNKDKYFEIITDNAHPNNSTAIEYNNENKKTAQAKIIEGTTYQVAYDGNGNTKGIALQKGETIEQFAEKFGCSVDDLKKINNKESFSSGDEIIVPGELEADDKKLTERKSAAEVKAEIKGEEEAKEAERQRKAEFAERRRAITRAKIAAENETLKPLGLKDRKGAGEKVNAKYNNTQRHVELTKVGNATFNRIICKDNSGKYYIVSHDWLILKEEYVKATNLYTQGKKVDCTAKNGNHIKCVEVSGYKDKHGRTLVVDKQGRYWMRSQKGELLKWDYIKKSNLIDAVREDGEKAREIALNLLNTQVETAEKALEKELKQEGWMGDVADALTFSDNKVSVVRKEFTELKNKITECKSAAQRSEEEFITTFKKNFGIEFNQKAVADYIMKPTPENYRKAFGTKQPIGERVTEYIESQQTATGIVKIGSQVAGAAVATALVGAGIAGTPFSGGSTLAASIAGASAIGAAVGLTTVAVDISDRATSEVGIQDGDWSDAIEDGIYDGVITAATAGLGKAATSTYKSVKVAKAASKAGKKATVLE